MDFIQEINSKYLALEAEVDRKLEKAKRDEAKLVKLENEIAEKSATTQATKILSYDDAITRNLALIKSLEMAKARLRSRSTFSPVEQILAKAIDNYRRDLEASLPRAEQVPQQQQQKEPHQSIN